jgi:hypothetical protein
MDVRALRIGIAALLARWRAVDGAGLIEEVCLRNARVRLSRRRRLLRETKTSQRRLSQCDAMAMLRRKCCRVHVNRYGLKARLDGGSEGKLLYQDPQTTSANRPCPSWQLILARGEPTRLFNLRKVKGPSKQCSMDHRELLARHQSHVDA